MGFSLETVGIVGHQEFEGQKQKQFLSEDKISSRCLMTTMRNGYGQTKAMKLLSSDLSWAIGLTLLAGLLFAQVSQAVDTDTTDESFASSKRSGARGFHEGIFDQGFGGFSTLKKRGGSRLEAVRAAASRLKRRPEMTSRGIHGDAFTGGFGDFYTMKKRGSEDLPRSPDPFSIIPLVQGYIEVLNEVDRLNDLQAEAEIVSDASDKLRKVKAILMQ